MQVLIYCQRDQSRTLDIPGHAFTPKEKTKRALQKLFAFWGLALASILVPVAHFVLVPVFFLLAPFLAYKNYQEEVSLEACELACPECTKTGSFTKIAGRWPLHNTCPHCMNRVYFDLVT